VYSPKVAAQPGANPGFPVNAVAPSLVPAALLVAPAPRHLAGQAAALPRLLPVRAQRSPARQSPARCPDRRLGRVTDPSPPRNPIRASCATTGCRTACSRPTRTWSTTAALPGTSSSISLGPSCRSDCATGHMGPNQRDLVSALDGESASRFGRNAARIARRRRREYGSWRAGRKPVRRSRMACRTGPPPHLR